MRTLISVLIWLLVCDLKAQPVISMFPPSASLPTNDLNGLVGWWTLDDLTGTDLSGNGNTLTFTGSPSSVTGKITNGVSFNGSSQYADAGNGASLGVTGNITMTAWVNVASFPTSSSVETIIGKGYDGNNEAYFLRLFGNSGTPLAQAGSFAGTGSVNYVVAWTISGWSTGTWHYLSATYDGTNWNLYFDGTLQVYSPQAQGALASGEDVTIGAEFLPTISRYFQGTIDDARIYNRALSAAEIRTQYEWPAGGRP